MLVWLKVDYEFRGRDDGPESYNSSSGQKNSVPAKTLVCLPRELTRENHKSQVYLSIGRLSNMVRYFCKLKSNQLLRLME